MARLAAEETLKRGFDWFEAVGEPEERLETANDPDLRPRDGRQRPDLRLTWGEKCLSGWRLGEDPQTLCAPESAPPGAPVQATTQIMMGHGPAPRNGMAVGAREVLRRVEAP